MDQKTKSIILLGLFLAVVVFLVVALVTKSWSIVKFTATSTDVSNQNVNFGLFRGNFGPGSSNKTSDNVDSKNALRFCQVYAIAGVVLMLIGYALLLFSNYKMAAIGILALGSISSILTAIIWGLDKSLNGRNKQGTQNTQNYGNVTMTDTFGYSWYIQLIASLVSAVFVGFLAYQIFKKNNLNIAKL